MRFLSIMGNSFGCSASGERLVSAARDGDFQEAKALLEYNPRLARYSTFGARNSPLHYSAAQGHHDIVSLLLESCVDINLRNFRGQTALMQACQFGHWEAVQILMLYKANIHKADCLNGGTALHFAALNGHSRCIRLLFVDYIPSIPSFWNFMRGSNTSDSMIDFDESLLLEVVNRKADGGITALHMAALNGHIESLHLLLDLGASVSEGTIDDGTMIDLIGAGSTPLHYAACGGNPVCCEILISRGASLTIQNVNGWTPLIVARSWNRNWLEGILSREEESALHILPSPYLTLPLMSIMKIAREHGWKGTTQSSPSFDPCAVCLERTCSVSAEGCFHEFCTNCALYLCSTNTSSTIISGLPGSIPCPLCRNAIISFSSLPCGSPIREPSRTSLSLSLCTTCPAVGSESDDIGCTRIPPLSSGSFRSLSCQRFPSMRQSSSLCMGAPETSPSLVRCPRSGLSRSSSLRDSGRMPWIFAAN